MSQFDKLISFGRQVSIRCAATQGRTDFVWSGPISRRVAWTKTGLATNLRIFMKFLLGQSIVLFCIVLFNLFVDIFALFCIIFYCFVFFTLIYCFVPLPILCFQDVPRLVKRLAGQFQFSCRHVFVRFDEVFAVLLDQCPQDTFEDWGDDLADLGRPWNPSNPKRPKSAEILLGIPWE